MLRSNLLLVFFLSLGLSNATAQSSAMPSYFPLEVGNAWEYIWVVDPPNSEPDTTFQDPFEVARTVTVGDFVYFVAPHLYGFADTLRDDGQGRIWARFRGEDVLLYDFTLGEGESYEFIVSDNEYENYTVTIERGLTTEVSAGSFDKVVRLSFRTQVSDSDRIFEFAPDVGPVAAYDGWGIYRQLFTAVVDGMVVSDVEEDGSELVPYGRAVAYPNPFRTSTTIVLPNEEGSRSRAIVYDVLGRPVATLVARGCSLDGCSFRWEGGDAPNGLYFVVADAGRGEVVNLVLAR